MSGDDHERHPPGGARAARRRPRRDAPPVSVDHPTALKALAHPARQRVLDLLHDHDEPITATQAAEACGLTPSAMSYHLRALEKLGIVERDDSSPDGRERPWRAVGSGVNVGAQAFVGVPADQITAYLAAFLAPLTEASARFAGELAGRPNPVGADTGTMSRHRLWLRPEEFVALRDRLKDALAPYQDRSADDHPEGCRPYDDYVILLPVDSGGSPETGAPGRDTRGFTKNS